MPVTWTISHTTRTVSAVANGTLCLQDVEAFLDAVVVSGALPYGKTFDVADAIVSFGESDMMALGARVRAYIELGPIGPLAIVAPSADAHWHARLFRVLAAADRPVEIFRQTAAARRWLTGQGGQHSSL